MKRDWTKLQTFYLVVFIVTIFLIGTGTTYAYWTATTKSSDEAIGTQSTTYSISMNVSPLYHDFSFIPMNDEDAIKAVKNKCKDKFDRGACTAYNIRVYGYDANLGFISGYMDIKTTNMSNLSYMMYMESDTYDDEVCFKVEEKNYCKVLEPNHMGEGTGLTLGDKYDVVGTEETNFVLLIWLSNLDVSQNATDIGSFNAVVTMQSGNGGEIKGVISSAVKVEDDATDGEGTNGDGTLDNGSDNQGDVTGGEETEG